MQIEKVIEFLGTETLNITFSPRGLKHLSLKGNKGEDVIDLRKVYKEGNENSNEYLLLKETWNFLKTGYHKMPLDLSGLTEFQQLVFGAISKTKVGEVYNYKDIAEMIENPGSAQAVGSAVLKNPVSYFLPTHRVFSKRGFPICKNRVGYLREKAFDIRRSWISKNLEGIMSVLGRIVLWNKEKHRCSHICAFTIMKYPKNIKE